jgi:hypothetical protein
MVIYKNKKSKDKARKDRGIAFDWRPIENTIREANNDNPLSNQK